MKIKPVFTIETKRTPSREGASGSYKPEKVTLVVVAAQGTHEQVIVHEVRED